MKMAVTPVLFEQIEKFHCLNPSTTQVPSDYMLPRVTCLKTCLEVSQLWYEITPKTRNIWFDGQWGLLVYHLSIQKIYVTSLVEFSTLLERRGEVWTSCHQTQRYKLDTNALFDQSLYKLNGWLNISCFSSPESHPVSWEASGEHQWPVWGGHHRLCADHGQVSGGKCRLWQAADHQEGEGRQGE